MNDPIWGITRPENVCNRDQVPLALCPNEAETVDDKGKEVILDKLTKGKNLKRFATLDLTILVPMKPMRD
jgi:hypothetical protein